MLTNTQTTIEGYLVAKEPYRAEKHLKAYQHLTSFMSNLSAPHNFTTLPREFPVGVNNMFMKNLSYQFYMSDYHVAELVITDAEKERYSIPEEVVFKPGINPTMKLEMIGLRVFQ